MKALVYTGPERLELRDRPDPVPGNDEVLVAVEAVGICGSDMHAYLGHDERRPAPLILGHEAAGTIATGPRAGTRVTVNPLVTCGRCPACLDGRTNLCPDRQIISMPPREGAFAGLVALPEDNLVPVPDGFPMEKAALAEPMACGYHAVAVAARAARRPLAAAPCVVLGGGAIGLGAALCLAAHGARDITVAEPNPVRHATLRTAGPFVVSVPGGDGPGADGPAAGSAGLVIDAVGVAATRKAASALVAPGGVIVHIGLGDRAAGLDLRRITLQEITLIGTYTYTRLDFQETFAAMVAGRLGALDWIEERPLADGAAAFADLRAGRPAAAKIVLRP